MGGNRTTWVRMGGRSSQRRWRERPTQTLRAVNRVIGTWAVASSAIGAGVRTVGRQELRWLGRRWRREWCPPVSRAILPSRAEDIRRCRQCIVPCRAKPSLPNLALHKDMGPRAFTAPVRRMETVVSVAQQRRDGFLLHCVLEEILIRLAWVRRSKVESFLGRFDYKAPDLRPAWGAGVPGGHATL